MTPHIEREIFAQGQAWRSALDATDGLREPLAELLGRARGREVRFLGAGSSYYLGLAVAPVWGEAGWSTRVLPAAEQLLHPGAYPTDPPPLVVAVSRSGATTETLRAVEQLRHTGSPALGVSTYPSTRMDEVCDLVVHVEGAQERSTVQTRSFSAQFLALQAVAWSDDDHGEHRRSLASLPDLADEWMRTADARMRPLADRFRRVYVLGTGMRWGLALEGALKLKETSLTESEAFQTLEFRHGPKSMIDDETLVVGLLGPDARGTEQAVLDEMRGLGAEVVSVAPAGSGTGSVDALTLPGARPGPAQGVLYLPPLQLLAYRRGVHKGLDPDHPRHLSYAVELDRL